MGTWGTGIFQNDVADDVKTDYINKLKMGKSDEDALSEIISENSDFLNDPEDSLDFWFSLASILFDYGRLTEKVKCQAISLLESDKDSGRWTEKENKKRKIELEKLKTKMHSEIPPRKKVAVTKKFVCPWKRNDIYWAKSEDICKDSSYKGYVLILVDDIIEYDVRIKGLGDLLPVTYVKVCDSLPDDISFVNDIPFIVHDNRPAFDPEMKEYRFLWTNDGFRNIKSKFHFMQSYDFNRPANTVCYGYLDEKLYMMEVWKRIGMFLPYGHFYKNLST